MMSRHLGAFCDMVDNANKGLVVYSGKTFDNVAINFSDVDKWATQKYVDKILPKSTPLAWHEFSIFHSPFYIWSLRSRCSLREKTSHAEGAENAEAVWTSGSVPNGRCRFRPCRKGLQLEILGSGIAARSESAHYRLVLR